MSFLGMRTVKEFVRLSEVSMLCTGNINNVHYVHTLPFSRTQRLNKKISRPATVKTNLKTKIDGTEKRFLSLYPDVIHSLSAEFSGHLASSSPRFTRILTNNLSTLNMGKRHGLLVPKIYKELGRSELELEANILGWTVELSRAATKLSTEIILDVEKARQLEPGESAVAHVKILESSVFILLKKYLGDSQAFHHATECLVEACLQHPANAYCLDLKLTPATPANFNQEFDMSRYKSKVYSTKTFPQLILPVSLALHLANMSQKKIHELSRHILRDVGLLKQVGKDFDKCFKSMEHDDIVEGRLTWLIVLAIQRGSPAQLRDLELSYGKSDQESVARVQEIYTDLRLHRNIPIYIEQKMADIEKDIQQIAKVDREGLSQSLFFNLLQDISLD